MYAGTPTSFLPVLFWIVSADPSLGGLRGSMTFCQPSMSLHNVTVLSDVVTGQTINLTDNGLYTTTNATLLSQLPYNGSVFNGIALEAEAAVQQRMSSVPVALSAAIFQLADESDEGGLAAAFAQDKFQAFSNRIYTTFLTLLAAKVYYLEETVTVSAVSRFYKPRLFLR